MKEILSALICIGMLLTGTPQESAFPVNYADPFEAERTEISFNDVRNIEYKNEALFRETAGRMGEICREEGALEELGELYGTLYNEMLMLDTLLTVADIEYYIDPTEEKINAWNAANDLYDELYSVFEEAVQKVLASEYSEAFTELIGMGSALMFSQTGETDEELYDLFDREVELQWEYEELALKEYTVEYQGREWTEEELYYSEKLTDEEYWELYDELMIEKNAEIGQVYLELVNVRNEIAQLCGYESYADFCYEQYYGRMYTAENARIIHGHVREYVAPVYEYLYDECVYDYYAPEIRFEEIIPAIRAYIPEISEEMAQMFEYMLEHDMCYLTDDLDQSLEDGFMVTLNRYAQPFIYNAVSEDEYGDFYGLTDTVHEFGHYCDAYLNAIYTINAPEGDYDLSEVLSSGLELLFYDYYDEIYGEAADDARAMLLDHALYCIVDSCMYDEAQQKVYAEEGELTLDRVNEIFRETMLEYGLISEYDLGLDWVDYSKLFNQPFYDISYVAAYAASMEIWMTAQTEGQEAAAELYGKLLEIGSYDAEYFSAIGACGMEGVMSEEYMEEMAGCVREVMMELTEG